MPLSLAIIISVITLFVFFPLGIVVTPVLICVAVITKHEKEEKPRDTRNSYKYANAPKGQDEQYRKDIHTIAEHLREQNEDKEKSKE